jgi:UDP-2-acetamido-2-deoxy-ribo-hexuluronate aminotransferase
VEFIDLKKQYSLYKTEIKQAIDRVLESAHFIMGQEVFDLEKALADFVQVKHCISTSNGTDSLEIALRALEIGPNDEVITTPFSWISSSLVMKLVGAKPVFVDIEETTYNIDVSKIEKAITPRTKAIMPVSLFGQMPDFEEINRIAKKYNIAVIEDGAQSFGASQNGKQSGSVSLIGATSFFPAKPLGCYGDGGALFTNDDALAKKMRCVRTYGGEKRYEHTMVGLNGRLDTLQAAILLAKLPHYPKEVEARARLGKRYSELLSGHCITPAIATGNTHTYAQYTIRVKNREEVMKSLALKGIPTGIYYPKGLHEQSIFLDLGYKKGDFPVVEAISQEVMSLPMHPFLTDEEQDFIVEALILALKEEEAVCLL